MREEELNSIAYSKNVIEFITVANEFCSFLERSESLETPDFLSRLQKILPLLYLKASMLPEFEFEAEDDLEKFVSEMDYNQIQQKILRHTGANDDYQEVFLSGMQFSESALTASISENVADIYQEMKDLVMSFRMLNDEVMEQAVWECKNNFSQLWGQSLVNCLRAIHNLIYAENTQDEQNTTKSQKSELKNTNRKPDWLNDRFSNQGE
ncbi:MAG: DUF5063 domain-containing protein [Prolixibacteraceae bacterium]|nr:DUF5063 domain-containing protein [Prolixibacteraceae bacterium]